MSKQDGVCTAVDGDSLILHFSVKDKEPGRVPRSSVPAAVVPAHLGPATRLLFAADMQPVKNSWDHQGLRRRAAELCSDIRVLRRLADDALALGWQHTFDWAPLSESEKAWRTAHYAAATGNVDLLRDALLRLPSEGYAARALLLLPHLAAIREQSQVWRPVLETLAAAGAKDAEAIRAVAVGSWSESLRAAASLAPDGRRSAWAHLEGQLHTGNDIPPPPIAEAPAWSAASLFSSSDRSSPLDAELGQLASLECALLDDLIDQGRLTSAADLSSLTGDVGTYLVARLDPEKLEDEQIRNIGHVGEYARRLFLARDKATLSGLEPSKRVEHYQALLDVVEGAAPDDSRLDPDTIRRLDLPATALAQIKEGTTARLPAEVAADPSLWPMFADVAISGQLPPDSGVVASDPLNIWIAAHRLLGLIWEGDLSRAVHHGKLLASQATSVEQQRDEILNLTSYALYQLGFIDDALELLEHALQDLYTDNLLVNASIVASKAKPEAGIRYLARLVSEAPTFELQQAGLDQAIALWEGTDVDFPQVLVPALRTVLSASQPIDDYLRVGRIAVIVAPEIISSLPDPGGELNGPYRLIQIRGRWKTDDNMYMSDLADEYIGLYRAVGRVEWFMNDWKTWVDTIKDSIFQDFGKAVGSAQFIDKVLVEARDLFEDDDRFLLAPQAGAHLNALFSESSEWLNAQALQKFFFDPIADFQQQRNTLTDSYVEFLASNFTLCLGNVGLHILGNARDGVAEDYNAMVQRLQWDAQNRYSILAQMRRILDDTEQGVLALLWKIVEHMRRLGSDKRRELTQALAKDVQAWQDEINGLRRNL